jgi:hypothetical protein
MEASINGGEVKINEFASDAHRRVAAQCSRPMSALEIAYSLKRTDPNVPDNLYHASGVQEILKDLEADGLVKNLGPFDDAEAALKAQDKDKDVINFEGSRETFIGRAEHPMRFPFLGRGDDHYVFTKECHARLTGPAYRPGEEPTGIATPTFMTPREFAEED